MTSQEKKKVTIAELEALLEGPVRKISINPDGSLTAQEEVNEATITRYKAYLKMKQKRCDSLIKAVKSANDISRSMLSIAEREGKETNWKPFTRKLKKSLKLQHNVLGGEG